METDRPVTHNKPDIIWIITKERKATIIDIAVPLDQNIQKTFSEKLLKYQDLAYDLKNTYQLKEVVILPFVISCNGIVHKEFRNNLKKLDIGEHTVEQCVKAAILGTVRVVR
ncbi:MAG: hypothetical protein KTM48_02745, partial [Wolbachia endosymbiont of Pissodes strobi]|nr:hypothetical protein [Wolbachia endosymbiont of Pissodes strobi]